MTAETKRAGRTDGEPRGGFGRTLARGSGRLFLGTWRLGLALLFVVGGIAVGGFLNFVHQVQGIETAEAATAPQADAVVVLTGGANRIDAGIELLAEARGRRMLISGVNIRTSSAALLDAAAGASETERTRLFSCCIDLGHAALDTVGNAAEAQAWIREGGFGHVLVVTSDYHMPRSLLEFRRALDAGAQDASNGGEGTVRLTAWPVETPLLRRAGWYRDPAAIRRMVGEWGKYLSAQSKGWFGAEVLKQMFPSA